MPRIHRAALTTFLAVASVTPVAAQNAAPAPPPAATMPTDTKPTATDESVKGAAAWDRLKGNTITGKAAGDTFAEFFAADGSVKYVDKDGLSSGSWTAQNDKVCVAFPDDDDRSCSTFTVKGTTGFAVDDDGQTTRFTIEPGNSKGL